VPNSKPDCPYNCADIASEYNWLTCPHCKPQLNGPETLPVIDADDLEKADTEELPVVTDEMIRSDDGTLADRIIQAERDKIAKDHDNAFLGTADEENVKKLAELAGVDPAPWKEPFEGIAPGTLIIEVILNGKSQKLLDHGDGRIFDQDDQYVGEVHYANAEIRLTINERMNHPIIEDLKYGQSLDERPPRTELDKLGESLARWVLMGLAILVVGLALRMIYYWINGA